MVGLKDLGFSQGIIVETIVSTYSAAGEPNAAPMGATMENEKTIAFKPYTTTTTYQNLQTKKCAVVNLTANAELFYITAFKEVVPEGRLPPALFGRAKSVDAPKLLTADSTIEVNVENLSLIENERAEVRCKTKVVQTSKILPKAYCRASSATIEAIVHATRIKEFLKKSREKQDQALELLEKIKVCHDVVKHVAPNSRYSEIMSDLTKRIETWRYQSESLR